LNTILFIARRLSAGDSSGRTSPAVKVAIASVALSIAIMLLAVSIVIGFRREIVQKVIGFNAHVTLCTDDDNGLLRLTPELDSVVSRTPGVVSSSMSISIPALLKTPTAFKGIYLRGLAPDGDTTFLHNALTAGKLPRSSGALLISASMARHLGITTGDSITLYRVADNVLARRMQVDGIYNSHFENYDDYCAYAPLSTVQELVGATQAEGSVLDITTTSLDESPHVASILFERLNNGVLSGELTQSYRVDTALSRGSHYFAWLDMLDTNVWIILTLMTLVAAFTLISGILIIILEKVRFIGVMKALGASSRRLGNIFVLLAVRIAATGLLIGNAVALLLIGIQALWHPAKLNPEAYYFDYVPVSLPLPQFLIINLAFVVIIYLVLLLPARLVARISPAESMRFEQA